VPRVRDELGEERLIGPKLVEDERPMGRRLQRADVQAAGHERVARDQVEQGHLRLWERAPRERGASTAAP
jgi:hypothetical protein